MLLLTICVAASAVIWWRLLHVVAILDCSSASPRLVALVLHWALAGAGSVAVIFTHHLGGAMLLAALALLILADRRRS